jgi:hypothetical protein
VGDRFEERAVSVVVKRSLDRRAAACAQRRLAVEFPVEAGVNVYAREREGARCRAEGEDGRARAQPGGVKGDERGATLEDR